MNPSHTESLAPPTWRSEAFAEDLFGAEAGGPEGGAEPAPRRWVAPVLGLVPVLVAAAGALLTVFNGF